MAEHEVVVVVAVAVASAASDVVAADDALNVVVAAYEIDLVLADTLDGVAS